MHIADLVIYWQDPIINKDGMSCIFCVSAWHKFDMTRVHSFFSEWPTSALKLASNLLQSFYAQCGKMAKHT